MKLSKESGENNFYIYATLKNYILVAVYILINMKKKLQWTI